MGLVFLCLEVLRRKLFNRKGCSSQLIPVLRKLKILDFRLECLVFTVTGVSYEVCTNELDGHPRGASLSGQDQLGSAPGTPYWSHFEDHGREQCNGHYGASGRI